MNALKVVRINGKRVTLSKANLNQLAAIASLGVDMKSMSGEDIGEAAPLMMEIVSQCLHSRKYQISQGTAIEWINENLDIDSLMDQAESKVQKSLERRDGKYAEGDNYDDMVDDELNRLINANMPDIIFLGDMDVQLLAELFAKTMPKKKATKQSKGTKAA